MSTTPSSTTLQGEPAPGPRRAAGSTQPQGLVPVPAKPRRGRPAAGKTRITIYLDDEVLEQFRQLANECGKGYQTLINATLRARLKAEPRV